MVNDLTICLVVHPSWMNCNFTSFWRVYDASISGIHTLIQMYAWQFTFHIKRPSHACCTAHSLRTKKSSCVNARGTPPPCNKCSLCCCVSWVRGYPMYPPHYTDLWWCVPQKTIQTWFGVGGGPQKPSTIKTWPGIPPTHTSDGVPPNIWDGVPPHQDLGQGTPPILRHEMGYPP